MSATELLVPSNGKGSAPNTPLSTSRGAHEYQFIVGFEPPTVSAQALTSNSTVVQIKPEVTTASQEVILVKLRDSGLIVDELPSQDKESTTLFYGITADYDMLQEHAELEELQIPLQPQFGGGYARFKRRALSRFLMDKDTNTVFKETDRMRIVLNIIRNRAQINMAQLQETQVITQFYPPHNEKTVDHLMQTWVKPFWKFAPIDEVKNYFGEKLGLYFAWLEYNTVWLAFASIFGLAMFALGLGRGDENPKISALVYSLGISLWGTLFTEFWKRSSINLTQRWNMDDWEESEAERPSYRGQTNSGMWFKHTFVRLREADTIEMKDDISRLALNLHSTYEPTRNRNLRLFLVSWPVTLVLVAVCIALQFALMVFRSYLSRVGPDWGQTIGSIINALIVLGVETGCVAVATKLTQWENWKFEKDYESAIITKRHLFQFVNNYGILFYTAFLKTYLGRIGFPIFDFTANCIPTDANFNEQKCIVDELLTTLASTFIIRIVLLQLLELLIPGIRSKCGCCSPKSVQQQAALPPYDGTILDYEEIVIQFGFVTLFASAFPLAPLAALINNIVEMRTDAWKILRLTKRPFWEGARSIGRFEPLLETMNFFSVIINSALIAFTTNRWESELTPYYLFIGIIAGFVLLKWLISVVLGNIPLDARSREARQKILANIALRAAMEGPPEKKDSHRRRKHAKEEEVSPSTGASPRLEADKPTDLIEEESEEELEASTSADE